MIILDSDVMIDILRQRSSAIAWLQSLGDEEIVLPGFVAMELLQGCRDKAEQIKRVILFPLLTYEHCFPVRIR